MKSSPAAAAPSSSIPSEKSLDISTLSSYFHMPINEASRELGICATVLKKICRKQGISRWPHRKFKSVDSLIEKIKAKDIPLSEKDAKSRLEFLEQTRSLLLKQPNLEFKSIVPKSIKSTGIIPSASSPLPASPSSLAKKTLSKIDISRRSSYSHHGLDHNNHLSFSHKDLSLASLSSSDSEDGSNFSFSSENDSSFESWASASPSSSSSSHSFDSEISLRTNEYQPEATIPEEDVVDILLSLRSNFSSSPSSSSASCQVMPFHLSNQYALQHNQLIA